MPEQPMTRMTERQTGQLTRRQLLSRSIAAGAGLVIGSGFIAADNAAWALEVKGVSPETMSTLVQMARDIYPHDRLGDALYAIAVKSHDTKAAEDPDYRQMLEAGVSRLDAAAIAAGFDRYRDIGWEKDRVAILQSLQEDEFFQLIRADLVVGLYNQQAVWKVLRYEGSSFEHGGYISRGFDDIDWL